MVHFLYVTGLSVIWCQSTKYDIELLLMTLIKSVSGEGEDDLFCHSEVDRVSEASEGPTAGGKDGAAADTRTYTKCYPYTYKKCCL